MCCSAWWGQSFVKELARISDQAERKHRIIRPTTSTLPVIGKVPDIVGKVTDIFSKDGNADAPGSSKEQDVPVNDKGSEAPIISNEGVETTPAQKAVTHIIGTQHDVSVASTEPHTPNTKAASQLETPETKASSQLDTPSTNNEPTTPIPILDSDAPPLKDEVTPIGSFPESPGP